MPLLASANWEAKELRDAEKRFQKAIDRAKNRYISDLKQAKFKMMQKGNLEEAVKVDKRIKLLLGKPDGTYKLILNDYSISKNTPKRTRHTFVFGKKIQGDKEIWRFIKDPRGFLLVDPWSKTMLWTMNINQSGYDVKYWKSAAEYKAGKKPNSTGTATK